jgi:indolepyruvate ferredoxin oxidoreductase
VLKMRDLPEPAKYDLALRVYDLLQYEDDAFARRYIELVKTVYARDTADKGFAATTAAIRGVAKAMLVKDEPYVAYLLTRYEKKVRDLAKYGVDESNGDRIVYRHHTSPEFNVWKWRVRLKITTSDWQLRLVRHCKWWRKIPGWHRREIAFRDWYLGLLDRADLTTDAGYSAALKVLATIDDVSGYREIRYPKMAAAMASVEQPRPEAPPATGVPAAPVAVMDMAEAKA